MALPPSDSSPLTSRDAAQRDGFLREVDEALREQQLVDAAKRYGKIVGGVIAVGLAAFAGYLWWDASGKSGAAEQSEKAIIALDKFEAGGTGPAAAVKDLEVLAKDGSPASKANAAMLLAAIAAQQGKTEDAAKRFAAIAADDKAPQPLRDLATIREVTVRFDAMPPQQVVDRLKPLAVPGNPWFGSAGELVGMAYLKQGKPQLAGPLFAGIAKDKDAPPSLRERAGQIAAQLGVGTGDADVPAAQLAPAAQ